MLTLEQIASKVLADLNIIAQDLGYTDIVFYGKPSNINYEWIFEVNDTRITPFALVRTDNQSASGQNINKCISEFSLYVNCKEIDRDRIYDIFSTYENQENTTSAYENYLDCTIRKSDTQCTYGSTEEINGADGYEHFQVEYNFTWTIAEGNILNSKSFIITIDGESIPFTAWNFSSNKNEILNKPYNDTEILNSTQNGFNTWDFTIASFIDTSNSKIMELYNESLDNTIFNKKHTISIGIDGQTPYTLEMVLTGGQITEQVPQDSIITLFFTHAYKRVSIALNNEVIPIVSYTIGDNLNLSSNLYSNDNFAKSRPLSVSLTFGFVINLGFLYNPTVNYPETLALVQNILLKNFNVPYTLSITLYGLTLTYNVIVSSRSIENSDNPYGNLSITFVEAV